MAKKEDKKSATEKPAAKEKSAADKPATEIPGEDITIDDVTVKEVTEIKTAAHLEAFYPELVAEIRKTAAAPESQTVEDLESTYPQLVSEIRDEVIRKIETCTAAQLLQNMPDLYGRIVATVQTQGGPNLKVPGFLLELDDPFAEATLRSYQKLKKVEGLRLPFVLPFKDKVTKAALENYAVRAAGGGDNARAKAARAAMEKTK